MTLIVVSAVLSSMFSNSVFAESQFGLPDPGLTPESPFYFLDTWDEEVRLFFSHSDSARLKRYRASAAERLSEAEKLAGRGISATQIALERYRDVVPRIYATSERIGDALLHAEVLRMAAEHLDILDYISERTDPEKKQFILATKLFLINQHLESLQLFAKRKPGDALRIFGDTLNLRMARVREVAIDDENNKEALDEYTAYLSETDRIVREWGLTEVNNITPSRFLADAVRGHEETLLGPIRDRMSPTLEQELLLVVNTVRKLSGKGLLPTLPAVKANRTLTPLDLLPAVSSTATTATSSGF